MRTDLARTKWTELRDSRLATSTDDERVEYDRAYSASVLAASIGRQIQAFRKEASVTQEELSERVGTSRSDIAGIEAGSVVATVSALQRIADSLGLTLTVELHRTFA